MPLVFARSCPPWPAGTAGREARPPVRSGIRVWRLLISWSPVLHSLAVGWADPHSTGRRQSMSSSELFAKYDVRVPRYTSYPTVPEWHAAPTAAQWTESLQRALTDPSATLSVYVHFPFCESLCTFCGCNTVITRDHGRFAGVHRPRPSRARECTCSWCLRFASEGSRKCTLVAVHRRSRPPRSWRIWWTASSRA